VVPKESKVVANFEKIRRRRIIRKIRMNWKLILAYDGTDFHGWQIQPDHITVQGELAAAIERVTGERVLPQGSGRTDAGVHALAQVASFELNAAIPPENLHRALNRTLPAAIRVLSAEHARVDFHARHSVRAKTYEYRILQAEICPPWRARYVYTFSRPLDLDRMEAAAGLVTGEHDFTSFAASDPDAATRASDPLDVDARPDNIRTIYSSSFTSEEGALLIYRVRGNGFLHHMVRNLVGTFIDVGRDHIAPEDVDRILKQRSRSAAGPTAPARGLFLNSVEY
jgi:tRNA pseudouridine38-40 synthase